jgi:hypothetical protein
MQNKGGSGAFHNDDFEELAELEQSMMESDGFGEDDFDSVDQNEYEDYGDFDV